MRVTSRIDSFFFVQSASKREEINDLRVGGKSAEEYFSGERESLQGAGGRGRALKVDKQAS